MLLVHEIFPSFDGEVNTYGQGHMTTFVRLSGCNLSCGYCDTPKSQDANNGNKMRVKEVLDRILEIGLNKVSITGGEPLLQESGVLALGALLSKKGIKVTCETNGTIAPNLLLCLNNKIGWVVDYKLKSSGANIGFDNGWHTILTPRDIVKFVISDTQDYVQAMEQHTRLKSICQTAFSPITSQLDPRELLSWLVRDKVTALFNVQAHKYVGAQ